MSKNTLYLLVLVSLIVAQACSLNSPPAHAGSPSQIDRLVYITDWGVTVINDTVTLAEGTSMRIGIPGELARSLRHASAKNELGASIAVSTSYSAAEDVLWLDYRIGDIKGTNVFHAVTVFSDRAKYQGAAFTFNFTQTPILENRIDMCNVTIILPKDSQVSGYENTIYTKIQYAGGPALHALFRPLEPMTREPLFFRFTSITVQIPKVSSVSRRIAVDSGGIDVEEEYRLDNEGPTITSLTIRTPEDAQEITATDGLGPLLESPKAGSQVSLSPRYGSLNTNDSFAFTLHYKIPVKGHLRLEEWWGKYTLDFKVLTPQPFIIDSAYVELVLPKGAVIYEIQPKPDEVKSKTYETISIYRLSDVTPIDDLSLKVGYRFSAFWAAYKPMIWSMLIIAAVTTLAATLRRTAGTLEQAPLPIELLRRYVGLQDEKAALRLEMESLEESMMRRAVSRHEFRRRRHAIDSRITAIDREQKSVKAELVQRMPRLADPIYSIERAEAEIHAVRIGLANIRAQYRAGKISKENFAKMEAEYIKRMEKAKAALDTSTVSLREDLG